MKIFILTDIFGLTDAIDSFVDDLGGDVEIIDPYDGEIKDFKNQEEAYHYFTTSVGQEAFYNKAKARLSNVLAPFVLVGFSIGATVAWRLSGVIELKAIGVISFYGSQIRNFKNVTPQIPTKLVFAHTEPSFDVSRLIQELKHRDNTIIEHTSYQHGFMSVKSTNFSQEGYTKYLKQIVDFKKP